MDGLRGISTPSSPPLHVASLYFPLRAPNLTSSGRTWESQMPQKIFWGSSSIGQAHRDLELGVFTGTERADPPLPWVLSAATKGKDLDAQLCDCGLNSAQLCHGRVVAIFHSAHRLTQLERHVLRPNHSMSELRGLQDLIFPSASSDEKAEAQRGGGIPQGHTVGGRAGLEAHLQMLHHTKLVPFWRLLGDTHYSEQLTVLRTHSSM